MTTTKVEPSYHHGDLPAALLGAVGDIVAEKGAANVSLREAARRAGVSHSAPAHHFGDKDGMLAAFCHQGFDVLGEQVGAALSVVADASPEVRIQAAGVAYVRFAAEHPAHFDVMFRTGLGTVEEASHDEMKNTGAMDLLKELVGEMVEAGRLPAEHAEHFAVSLWASAHGLASLWVDGAIAHMFPGMTLDELLDAAFGEAMLMFRATSLGEGIAPELQG